MNIFSMNLWEIVQDTVIEYSFFMQSNMPKACYVTKEGSTFGGSVGCLRNALEYLLKRNSMCLIEYPNHLTESSPGDSFSELSFHRSNSTDNSFWLKVSYVRFKILNYRCKKTDSFWLGVLNSQFQIWTAISKANWIGYLLIAWYGDSITWITVTLSSTCLKTTK